MPSAASSARPAATRLLELASGIDDRPVDSERPIKSVSHEETFAFDLHDGDELRTELARLADGVASTAARRRPRRPDDLTQGARRHVPHDHQVAHAAPPGRLGRGDPDDGRMTCSTRSAPSGGVRLLGVAASKFAEPAEQLQLDGLADERAAGSWSDASRAIDRVRGRFGGTAIGPASALSPAGLRVVRRGQHQWGTDEPTSEPNDAVGPALRNR